MYMLHRIYGVMKALITLSPEVILAHDDNGLCLNS